MTRLSLPQFYRKLSVFATYAVHAVDRRYRTGCSFHGLGYLLSIEQLQDDRVHWTGTLRRIEISENSTQQCGDIAGAAEGVGGA